MVWDAIFRSGGPLCWTNSNLVKCSTILSLAIYPRMRTLRELSFSSSCIIITWQIQISDLYFPRLFSYYFHFFYFFLFSPRFCLQDSLMCLVESHLSLGRRTTRNPWSLVPGAWVHPHLSINETLTASLFREFKSLSC